MLTHLQIRDFAIIDSVELELRRGLTVLTGETGAGKSILVDALQLLAGGRAGAEVVRHGAERAEVSGTFELGEAPPELRQLLEEQSVSGTGELTVRRVVAADGRSRAYLNGQTVPVQLLREAGNILIDIHGQHEFQSLTRSAAQRALLDGYGSLTGLTTQVGTAHREWLELLNRTLELESKARDRDTRLELLRYQAQELQALQLKAGEIDALGEERARLANRGRLAQGAQTALAELYENEAASAHAGVSRALQALRGLAALDGKLAAVLPMLEEASIQVREAARELERYRETLDVDAARQDEVERRLAAIEELSRKHRVAAGELDERARQLAVELATLERAETDLATLRKELAAALQAYRAQAQELSGRRAGAAAALARDISARMQTLGMSGGRFEADVTQQGNADPTEHGIDQIEFRVSANPGQPPRALAKVASGGELARLSLAVQVACSADATRCMVFDEVDAGIGGAVAEIVGRELRALGAGAQDRVEELARMLGGIEVSGKAREHAREMLHAATLVPGKAVRGEADHAPPASGETTPVATLRGVVPPAEDETVRQPRPPAARGR